MNDAPNSLSRPLPQTLARLFAIALAIAVVAWLAWRAQRSAGDARSAADESDRMLSSSKSLVIEPVSEGGPTDATPLLFSSKFGAPLQADPPAEAEDPVLLPSSKSLVIEPTPQQPNATGNKAPAPDRH